MNTFLITIIAAVATLNVHAEVAPIPSFQTRYSRIVIDGNGFITSLMSRQSGKEYSPVGHPSPLLSLHEDGQPNDKLLVPVSAAFHPAQKEIELKYSNGAVAVVKAEAKETYFRFQIVSLEPRGKVDNIVWGPLHTTVSKIIGDIIGVVREDDWAIGMMGLDDNTITGPVEDGDCYGMGYYIHSPDPVKCPVPAKYKEGQWFRIGGNGISDTAFYSHPEEYFQQVFGSGAKLEPEFGSTVAYHSRDRRKSYTHLFSLLPGFQHSRPRHQVSDPVEGVDFIGSGIALYACPDELGLATIEKITLAEGLPHIVIGGKWIRDPSAFTPTVYWGGPVDKAIEYTKALGFKDISRDTGEFYASGNKNWEGRVGFSTGKSMSYKEFADEAHKQGVTHGGLHTLCLFLQGGVSRDVTPVPSEHLQTVCRTKLANDISATDTNIVVTDPSFLAEKGTWPQGDNSNYLQIGGEMLRYDGISETAPWTLIGIKRGHASKAVAHKAGDELVKLQQNCYNGFVPDMKLMLDYAEYYADLMYRNGMDTINFDGFESTVYLNHGYYGVRIFCRRLFETYAKLTGGRFPRVTGSNVFAGSWEYMNVCDVGGGDNMFNAVSGRRAIEGKDIGTGFSSSYFPATFGIQGFNSGWSLYDAENLQAKAVGWDATYALSVSQAALDNCGERDAIFKAFRAWQNARALGVFTKEQKLKLRDPDYKFHLEQTGEKTFTMFPVKETKVSENAGNEAKQFTIANPYDAQSLRFSLRVSGGVNGCVITLPDGTQIKSVAKMEKNQFIICKGNHAYLADSNRKKIAELALTRVATLPVGESKIGVQLPGTAKLRVDLTVWAFGKGETLGGTHLVNAATGATFIRDLRDGKKVTIVTLGTSLTGGTWRWPDVMKEWLDKEFPGLVTLHNLGVGASASSHPPGKSGLDMVKKAVALKPDVVFIEFTTNDAYLPYNISQADSKRNLNTMIDAILAGNPNAEIILQTMNSVKDNPKAGAGNLHASTRPELAKYAQGYRDVARERGLLLVDNYPNWLKIMTENPDPFDRLVPDRIHPQAEGYRQVMLPALKEATTNETH